MIIKVNTKELKDMLKKVKKGMGDGKVLPITQYIELLISDNIMYITSTDLTIWITCEMEITCDETGEGKAIIDGKKFINLINKTTTESVTLDVGSDRIVLEGNGKYEFPVLKEEFPEYDIEVEREYTIDVDTLKDALKVNKASLATEMMMPCLTGYYISDKIVSTDSIRLTVNDIQLFGDESILLPTVLVEAVNILEGGNAIVTFDESVVMIETENVKIFGPLQDGVDEYPDLSAINDISMSGRVEVNPKKVVKILDRMSIFVDGFKVDGVLMDFQENLIKFQDLDGINGETLECISIDFEPMKVAVDLRRFLELLKCTQSERVIIEYGSEQLIKIKDDKVTHCLATLS